MQGIFNNPRRPPRQDFFYKVLVGSFIAHLAFFAFGLFIHAPGVRRTFFAPVYTVTLVEPRAPAKKPAARKKAVKKKVVKTRPKKAAPPRKRAKETVKVAKKRPAAPPVAKKETVSVERALAGIKERVKKKEAEELVARRIEELKKKQAQESEAVERSLEELKKSIAAMAEEPPPPEPVEREAAPAAAPSGRITMENLKAEYPEYYRAIRDRVWENWIYPMDLGGKDVEVIIAIKIGRSGELLDKEIEKSSGNRILDQSLVGAIMKAAPFPPLPEGMPGEYLDTGLRFCPGCVGK